MKASEIKKLYPSGTRVIDCFGQEGRIIGSYLTVSEFHPAGTLVLGGEYIYSPETNRWAEVVDEIEIKGMESELNIEKTTIKYYTEEEIKKIKSILVAYPTIKKKYEEVLDYKINNGTELEIKQLKEILNY